MTTTSKPVSTPQSTNDAVSILLVDAHPLTRCGIRTTLMGQCGFQIVGEASSPYEALTLAESLRPAIVVMELLFEEENGFDLIKDLRIRVPECGIVIYSIREASAYSRRCLKVGAMAYVSKSESPEQLVDAIRTACLAMASASPKAELDGGSDTAGSPMKRQTADGLSDGEFTMLHLISEGLSNRQISRTLVRSIKTVETYRSRLKKKLGASNSTQLAQMATAIIKTDGRIATNTKLADAAIGKRRKVLLVDEDAAVGDPLANLLRQRGYAARHVGSAFQALSILQREQISLLIIGAALPDITPIEFLEKLRAEGAAASIPVIAITGVADVATLRYLRTHTKHVLNKTTFNCDELFARLETALDGRA